MATDWSEDIAVVDLSDEPALSEDIAATIDRVKTTGPPPHVVLNFLGVRFLNSSNLAQLLELRKALAAHDRQLRLCAVNDEIWSVMLVTGLDKVFGFAPDPMTALAGLQLWVEDPESPGS